MFGRILWFLLTFWPMLWFGCTKSGSKIIKNTKVVWTSKNVIFDRKSAHLYLKSRRFLIKCAWNNENDITFMQIARHFSQMTINGSVENCLTKCTLMSSHSKIHDSIPNCRFEEVPSTGQGHLVYLPRWQPCTRTVERYEKTGHFFFGHL